MNFKLNRILTGQVTEPLKAAEIKTLFDYFNLCAEGFLFYKASYVDEEIWQSWLRGMAHYAEHPRILTLWRQEGSQESYSGFRLDEVERLLANKGVAASFKADL